MADKGSRRASLLALFALTLSTGSGTCQAAAGSDSKSDPAGSGKTAAPADTTFDTESAEAMKALVTPEGKAYDDQLGHYLAGLPDYAASMKQCMALNPKKQSARGYLRFDAEGKYRVVLHPEGEFATCLVRFLEGRTPPKPPRLPYFNTLSFTP